MGKDKYENEDLSEFFFFCFYSWPQNRASSHTPPWLSTTPLLLYLVKYGLPEDCWFHVDDLSSAHVYLRLKPGMTLDDIPEEALLDCASLVKANSIQGCKKHSVYVVYTRWKNLKKTNQMVDGQVGYHRPENVRRMEVEKNNDIVKLINKTKEERYPDLSQLQQDRLREIQLEKKADRKRQEKEKALAALEEQQRQEELSYDRLMDPNKMTNVAGEFSSLGYT
jgi:hypothetical protein